MYEIEQELFDSGLTYIAGTDEAGRGPLAGPVVAAAVVLKKGCYIEGVTDSKKLSEKKREELFDVIIKEAEAYSIKFIDEKVIDEINIRNASFKAMCEAVDDLKVKPELVLVDGIGVGDVGSIVLRDRKHLGQDGLIIAVCTLDAEDGTVISGPDIVSRGFVYVRESEPLMDDARKRVLKILEDCAHENVHEWGIIKTKVKDDLSKLFYERTRRNPMILPVIMEV